MGVCPDRLIGLNEMKHNFRAGAEPDILLLLVISFRIKHNHFKLLKLNIQIMSFKINFKMLSINYYLFLINFKIFEFNENRVQ